MRPSTMSVSCRPSSLSSAYSAPLAFNCDIVMAYIVMVYIVMVCIVMAYIVMAYIVMASEYSAPLAFNCEHGNM